MTIYYGQGFMSNGRETIYHTMDPTLMGYNVLASWYAPANDNGYINLLNASANISNTASDFMSYNSLCAGVPGYGFTTTSFIC